MTKTKQNVEASEEFIRSVLEKNFKQKVDPDELRDAAEKLCAAIPQARPRPTVQEEAA